MDLKIYRYIGPIKYYWSLESQPEMDPKVAQLWLPQTFMLMVFFFFRESES